MKFENIKVYNFENALRGMRNPKNSWSLSDSKFGYATLESPSSLLYDVAEAWANCLEDVDDATKEAEYNSRVEWLIENGAREIGPNVCEFNLIGPKDMKLAKALIAGGSEHRKFLRQIFVSVDITAPLYWWKEFDTYKVGTAANSTSTMHKLTSKPITLDSFEIGDYTSDLLIGDNCIIDDFTILLINHLEDLRVRYLETKDVKYWKELVRWLPESWLQTRTVTMNYENLFSMLHQRRYHKLAEWSDENPNSGKESFIKFAKSLPYIRDFCESCDNISPN